MKSSFEQPSVSTMALKRGVFLSASSAGVMPCSRAVLQHLDAMLVGAGQEIDVMTVQAFKTRERVSGHSLVGVSDMRPLRSGRRLPW